MRNLMSVAMFASFLIFGSCSKEKVNETLSPDLVTSTFEISLSNPPSISKAGDGTVIGADWEMETHNITMFVYEDESGAAAKPVHVKKFTEYEVKKGKAVFAIEGMDHTKKYDFYAIANCGFNATDLSTGETGTMTREKMTGFVETTKGIFDGGDADADADAEYGTDAAGTNAIGNVYGSLSSYNGIYGDITKYALRGRDRPATGLASDDYSGFGGTNHENKAHNKGFIMTGESLDVVMAGSGTNIPTTVDISLCRTVAKVEANVIVSPEMITEGKYLEGSTLKFTQIKLTNLAAKTPLMPPTPTLYNTENFGTATFIVQKPVRYEGNELFEGDDTGVITLPATLPAVEYKAVSYKSLFYIYENSDGLVDALGMNEITDDDGDKSISFQPVLVLNADFHLGGHSLNPDGLNKITYKILLAGENGALAGTEATTRVTEAPDLVGLIKRNGYYKINVTIKGLSENEIFATVEVLNWAAIKTQDVIIGE